LLSKTTPRKTVSLTCAIVVSLITTLKSEEDFFLSWFKFHSLFEGQKSPWELNFTGPVPEIFKYIFLANQRDEFENFWNWFGKSKFPGALLPLK